MALDLRKKLPEDFAARSYSRPSFLNVRLDMMLTALGLGKRCCFLVELDGPAVCFIGNGNADDFVQS